MRFKKIIGAVLIAAIAGTGCSAVDITDNTVQETESVESFITETETETEVVTSETEALVPWEFNPHVYSPKIAERIPEDYWDSFNNLCDALREGEATFECSSYEAFEWCTDVSVLCNLFPAAGAKVEPAYFEETETTGNGTGNIRYTIPVEEYAERQADFEALITGILNDNVESDDSDYEMALKLYLYMANNYEYDYDKDYDYDDNFVYHTFMCKKGVCVDFASVYAYLLLQVGIDAISVGCFEENMCHSWTYAVIDGRGYHIDPTWALKINNDGVDYIYLDYFLMSDKERNIDGALVHDLTVSLVPEFWINRTSLTLPADDNSFNLRDYCNFESLDEENKILNYVDMYGNEHEFYYEQNASDKAA